MRSLSAASWRSGAAKAAAVRIVRTTVAARPATRMATRIVIWVRLPTPKSDSGA